MEKPRGAGRAHIHNPRGHVAGALKGGKLHPQFNPHFEVKDQGEPTTSDPRPRRFKHRTAGHVRYEK